jgi:transposase InsO family protein
MSGSGSIRVSAKAPGSLEAAHPLEIVQVDHTQSDVFVVDRWTRRPIGRPWLSVAIDVATRCVVAIFLAMGHGLRQRDWGHRMGPTSRSLLGGIPR